MRTRNGKGRHGEIYPLIEGSHGICVKRNPLYLTAEDITNWWLDENQIRTWEDMTHTINHHPFSRRRLLQQLTTYYRFIEPADIRVSQNLYRGALAMIRATLKFPTELADDFLSSVIKEEE
tara:strand:+ start:491 stop:853 length:363 start_codon:yes stop_codon:yes gene_type:complete